LTYRLYVSSNIHRYAQRFSDVFVCSEFGIE
jgi:hypothetical protein